MRIYTTRRLVAALMDKYDIESKYGLAKLMSASQKSVSNWINEGRTMDDKHALKAAQLLDLDYEFILICMQLERNQQNPASKRAWSKIASAWERSNAAAFTFGVLLLTAYQLPYIHTLT